MHDYEVKIDLKDYKEILQYKGYGIVYNSEKFTFDKFEMLIVRKFERYLPDAKALIINFKVNKKEPLISIQKCMNMLQDNQYLENADVIFGVEYIDDIKVGECEIELVIIGIDNTAILMTNLLS